MCILTQGFNKLSADLQVVRSLHDGPDMKSNTLKIEILFIVPLFWKRAPFVPTPLFLMQILRCLKWYEVYHLFLIIYISVYGTYVLYKFMEKSTSNSTIMTTICANSNKFIYNWTILEWETLMFIGSLTTNCTVMREEMFLLLHSIYLTS